MWDDDDKAVALVTSLRGAAVEIIQIIPVGKRTEFAEIVDALEWKYGSKRVKEVSHLELSSRCQKLNERSKITQPKSNSWPISLISLSNDVLERLKIDAFVRGLRDVEFKKTIWMSPKTTFTETLGFAFTQDAASVLWTSSMELRRTEVTSESDNLDVVCAALRQVLRENRQVLGSKIRKCYVCQKPGHFARECRSKHRRTHSTSPTRNFCESASEISNKHTGVSHSNINSTIVKEKFDPLVGARFRTATGEEAAIKGKIMRNISTSDVSMKHEFLVADIMDEVILGMDFMAKQSFVLDMKRQVLQYTNVTLPLTVGYDRQAVVLQIQRQQKIPPNSEAIVWAAATEELRINKIWVVEPSKQCTKDNIIIGKAVVSPVNNLIPVRVLNPTSVTAKIHKGDIIAQCQKAEYVVNHQTEILKICPMVSIEAEILIKRSTSNLDEQQKKYAKKFLPGNWSIFASGTDLNGRTNAANHIIHTAGADPIRQRPRRIPLAKGKK
ncbi:uncharacterized protein ACN427_009937 isoform 1-T5 [Glossina fuscipes fuscipes]